MGEKIKDLQKVILKNKEMVIELNQGIEGYDIHIEIDKLRFALNDSEYMKFVFAVSEAKRKLMITKDKG